MLRSILIGLDGSPQSDSALKLGIQWAQQHGAMLVGLGIIDEPTICQSGLMPIGGSHYKEHRDEAILSRARRRIEECQTQFTKQCSDANVRSTPMLAVGAPIEIICREAQRFDLVLLGQETHFHFATQDEPCETLEQVLKQSCRPVVAVPQNWKIGRSAVIAYDGSLQAARTLQAFQTSGLAGSLEIHVVIVGENVTEMARHTDRALEFLRHHNITANALHLEADSAGDVILDQARILDAQLLVMGAYGQSKVREFFLGSVTRSTLKKSTVPLFLDH